MQNNSDTFDEEISLSEIWKSFVRYKWWVLGIPAVAMVIAFFVTSNMKPQWEATALVQIGQIAPIGSIGSIGQGFGGRSIESASRAKERMKQISFQQNVFWSLALPVDRKSSNMALFWNSLFRSSLKVKTIPTATDLVEIKVRGYSPAEAKQFAEATVANLRKIHDMLAAPAIQHLHKRVARSNQQLVKLQEEWESLLKVAKARRAAASEGGFMESIVLAALVAQQDEALRNLEQVRATSEELLTPVHNYPTSLIEDVSVSEEPVAPRKFLIVMLAGILGLFGGASAGLYLKAHAN